MSDDLVVGLDVGTSKVCAIIGELRRNGDKTGDESGDDNGEFEITGVGCWPSAGLRKGVVVNIEAVMGSIEKAIEIAETMSACEVKKCWLGIGGSHIESRQSHGSATITDKREQREVGYDDIQRALDLARKIKFPLDRLVLDVIPQSYTIDDQTGIRDPIGMIGTRLDCDFNIITCAITSAQNLNKCINQAGFEVESLILQTLAAGSAVLTPEEKDLGCVLIDLGGGTTNMLVYNQGVPCQPASVPVGGIQVSSDISIVTNVSPETAERIKLEAGCCWEPLPGENIIVPGIGGRQPLSIARETICAIIRPRMEEIFAMVKGKLAGMRVDKPLGAGVVLTGGGSKLPGVIELAEEVFNMPVRIGTPLPLLGLADQYRDPAYATAIGLVIEAKERRAAKGGGAGGEHIVAESTPRRFGGGIFSKIANWVQNEFF